MKKLTIVAALAMATAAVAIPSSASAIWLHNHAHIQQGNNPQLHSEGTLVFQGAVGQIECTTATTTMQLTGGTTTGHVNQFAANNPQTKCHTKGGVIDHCVVTAVQPFGLPWLMHTNNFTGIQVTGTHFNVDQHGFLCPDFTMHMNTPGDHVELTGEENGVTGPHKTIQSLKIEGVMTGTPSEDFLVSGTISGTAGQQNTYGWT